MVADSVKYRLQIVWLASFKLIFCWLFQLLLKMALGTYIQIHFVVMETEPESSGCD